MVERVAILESRVDRIEGRCDRAEQAHQKNIELLNALRVTQAEQTQTLAGHTRRLDSIDGTLAGHTRRLDSIDGKLGMITVGVHAIETMLRRLTDDEAPQ